MYKNYRIYEHVTRQYTHGKDSYVVLDCDCGCAQCNDGGDGRGHYKCGQIPDDLKNDPLVGTVFTGDRWYATWHGSDDLVDEWDEE